MEQSIRKIDLTPEDDLYESICKIDDRLYLSDGTTAHCKLTLEKYGVTHIINATHNVLSKFQEDYHYTVNGNFNSVLF